MIVSRSQPIRTTCWFSGRPRLIYTVNPLTSACPFSWLPKLRSVSKNPLSDKNHSTVKDWIRDCETKHVLCGPRELHGRPKRLLYLPSSNEHIVQLVSGAGKDPYIALSHCWGGEKPTSTTMVNEPSMRCGILISELPKPFQDAIQVARWIGVPYIWIDSLCIVQDDAEDWKEESKKRADIYTGCYLAIGATRSSSCEEGFLQPREGSVSVGLYSALSMIFEVFSRRCRYHQEFLGSIETYRAECPLISRGWCFQERILAPRMIHFVSHELIYQCREGEARERGHSRESIISKRSQHSYYEPSFYPSIAPRYRTSTGDSGPFARASLLMETPSQLDHRSRSFYSKIELLYPRGKRENLNPTFHPIIFGELWGEIVTDYTSTKLTYDEDILPALSGLSNLMQVFSPGMCLAG
jgi:hypothetical protein